MCEGEKDKIVKRSNDEKKNMCYANQSARCHEKKSISYFTKSLLYMGSIPHFLVCDLINSTMSARKEKEKKEPAKIMT